jgi:porin
VRSLLFGLVLVPALAHADGWTHGDHLTGEWRGTRSKLADAGLTLDVVYASEVFHSAARCAGEDGTALLGHLDVALTLDTEKLGVWPGGKLYGLVQDGRGTGIDRYVGSATQVSNLEADPYTQITELFYEQTIGNDRVVVRIGKQDANRDFGTPRFGGNFINNNFGMFPTTPLPSYPTTGLGLALVVRPVSWLATKAAIYEGNPIVHRLESLGIDNAFANGAGYTVVGGVAATHHYGTADRHEGTTSVGVWHQTGEFPGLDLYAPPQTFATDNGFFVQHDERVYLHPENADDPRDLNLIVRFGWAQADRTQISRFMDASFAWHGIGRRTDDTVGIGVGYFTVARPSDGMLRPSDEVFAEMFYKVRLTPFASLQPDVEVYRHPDGDRPDALLVGLRAKVKL